MITGQSPVNHQSTTNTQQLLHNTSFSFLVYIEVGVIPCHTNCLLHECIGWQDQKTDWCGTHAEYEAIHFVVRTVICHAFCSSTCTSTNQSLRPPLVLTG